MIFLFCIFSYLMGCISFGLLLSKWKNIDLRSIGSGNIGATNIARVMSKKYAFLVFLLDGFKGLIPICLFNYFTENDCYSSIVAISAVLGHVFPFYLKFKGGKGVAITFMLYFAFNAIIAVAILLCWISIFLLFRISSLSAIVAIFLGLILSIMSNDFNLIVFSFFTFILIIYKHKENIIKLINKNEHKF